MRAEPDGVLTGHDGRAGLGADDSLPFYTLPHHTIRRSPRSVSPLGSISPHPLPINTIPNPSHPLLG